MNGAYQFTLGAIAMGSAAAGFFFLKFWRRTRERLFGIFAASFFILALERLVLGFLQDPSREEYPAIYLIRLSAFLLILAGIADKNWSDRKKSG